MTQEKRWRYHFRNFSRAYSLLREALETEIEELNQLERDNLLRIYRRSEILPLSGTITRQAVSLGQQRPMGLGDGSVATTVINDLTLVTHNTEDFRWISELELLDPLTNNP